MRLNPPSRTWRFALLAFVSAHLAGSSARGERFPELQRLEYQLEYASDSQTDFRALFGPAPQHENQPDDSSSLMLASTIQFRLRAIWEWVVLERSDAGVLLMTRFSEPEAAIRVNGQPAPEKSAALAQRLEQRTYVRTDARGVVTEIAFPPNPESLSNTTVRVLLASVQFALVPDATSQTWETEEMDPNGTYAARYERIPGIEPLTSDPIRSARGLRTIRKTRLRYTSPPGQRKFNQWAIPTRIEPGGSILLKYDVEGHLLQELAGTETQQVTVSSRSIGHATNSLQLRLKDVDRLDETAVREWRNDAEDRRLRKSFFPLSVDPAAEQLQRTRLRAELKGATNDDLLNEVRLLDDQPDRRAETALALKLDALIHLDPACCCALVNQVEGKAIDSPSFRLIPAALANVGHNTAQEALVAIVRDRMSDRDALLWLIPLLSRPDDPIPAIDSTLNNIARGVNDPIVNSAAELALGSIARSCLVKDPARAETIVNEFTTRLKPGAAPADVRRVLLVLGNTGSPRALPTITQFLHDDSASVRVDAVHALRFIEGGEAESLLLKSLTNDADEKVRRQAAESISFRLPTSSAVGRQQEALRAEPSAQVRLIVLNTLWQSRAFFPGVEGAVRQAARHDPDGTVRNAAAQLIQ